MSTSDRLARSKTLRQMTDAELEEALAQRTEHIQYSYSDLNSEIGRREQQANTRTAILISGVAMVVSALSLVGTVLVALLHH